MACIKIKVAPGKKKRGIILEKGREGLPIVALTSHPTKGKANKELLEFLKGVFGKQVEIKRGHSSREKLICVELSEEELFAALRKAARSEA